MVTSSLKPLRADLEIKSRFADYRVQFLASLADCLTLTLSDKSQYLVDENVYKLYRKDFEQLELKPLLWPATEEMKTFANLERAYDLLLDAGFKKNSRLVVVGGGILQDAGGFVASTIFRGVAWDLIPTTLLAQADSCIGAKTSVNLNRAKNMIGTFSAPARVLLTPDVLKTLSPGDLRSGLCEAVKLAMVDGPETVQWMSERLAAALQLRGLDEFLFRTLMVKKRFIEEDEFDRGVRNLLNYGHTFGHAFESLTQYMVPHGVAVGLGIEAAEYFSWRLGLTDEVHFRHVEATLKPLIDSAKVNVKNLGASQLIAVMKTDKKNTSGDITFILSRGYGNLLKHPLAANRAEDLMREYLSSLPA